MSKFSNNRFYKWGILLASIPLVVACGSDDGGSINPGVDGGVGGGPDAMVDLSWFDEEYRCETEPTITWSDVNDWHYQLQYADYQALAASKYDLMVLFYVVK